MARSSRDETRCQGTTKQPTPPIHQPTRPSRPSERALPTRRRLRPCLALRPTTNRPHHPPKAPSLPSRPRCTRETRRPRPNTTIPRQTTPTRLLPGPIRDTTATIPPRYAIAAAADDDAGAKLEEMHMLLTLPVSRALQLSRLARPISLARSRDLSSAAGPPATSSLAPRASTSSLALIAEALPRPQS